MKERLMEKIAQGKVLYGTHVINDDIFNAEVVSQCGFDYIWIDMEHTEIDKRALNGMILGCRGGNRDTTIFVRVPKLDPDQVKPVLDMGADGIIFPMIRTREDVDLAVASCYYPPRGIRGFSPKRATRNGMDDMADYVANSGDRIWKLIQIETKEAYENLDEILGNRDVDVFIIGPADSSGAFGHLPNYRHPEVMEHIVEAIGKIKAVGKPVAVSVGVYDFETAKFWMDLGVDMISMGTEFGYIINGCKETLRNMAQAFDASRKD